MLLILTQTSNLGAQCHVFMTLASASIKIHILHFSILKHQPQISLIPFKTTLHSPKISDPHSTLVKKAVLCLSPGKRVAITIKVQSSWSQVLCSGWAHASLFATQTETLNPPPPHQCEFWHLSLRIILVCSFPLAFSAWISC